MICIPVRAQTEQELQQKLAMAACEGDFIEIWLDGLAKETCTVEKLEPLFKETGKPVVAVCKPVREQGSWSGSEAKRMERLLQAMDAGAIYLDVSIETAPKLIKAVVREVRLKRAALKAAHGGPYLILSYHHFKETPSRLMLKKIIQRAKALGADAVKIATQVTKTQDNLVLCEMFSSIKGRGLPAIVIGMGPQGRMTRAMMPLLGALWTYAPLVTEESTADGQMTVQELRTVWQKMGWNPQRI